ncbi:hypothetical protein RHGRI_001617 [Rhododendron griersonianum]|uniref:DUF4378 domain-containing protein n=1 Tax=Rhododendron griersonianum TaxID=479676 RepID=A0AAV6LNE1_9ERIC|nr:hypothetical protein RHGRI_001617 [Rhododendron griersonianum]
MVLSTIPHPILAFHFSGAGYSNSKLQMLTNFNEASQENHDSEERDMMIADAGKTSVKELMEEEIFGERDEKQHSSNADTEAKESDMERRRRPKKIHKRTKKTSKSSGDLHFQPDAAETLTPESFDLEVVINELCQQKSTNCTKHDWSNEKIIEAIKVFLDRRLKDGNHLIDDQKIDNSREFVKALQTSSSNKELILELLKDPNSLLVKKIGDLEDSQLEKGRNFDPLANYGELKESKPSVPVDHKHHSFFRRRSKSQENITLAGNENSQGSNRIVILRPVLTVVKISETERKPSSSLQTEKIASQFSFAEIKRKLKNAMGKERNGPSDDKAYKFPNEHQKSGNSEKGIVREKGGWNSPNRNHFFIERFARPAVGRKKKDKNIKPKDTEKCMGSETVEYPEQRVSDIYVEAKKHLSEMLSNGDGIEDFSSRQLPKTLGRLLSLPEFYFSPICSPRMDNELKFVTAQKRLSTCNNFHVVNEDTRQLTPKTPDDKVLFSNFTSDVLDELNHDDTVEGTSSPTRPEKTSEGDVGIELTVDSLVLDKSEVLDLAVELCSSSVIRDDQNSDLAEVCDEGEPSKCLKLELCEHEDLPSSPSTSPPSSSITKQVAENDGSNERAERPSPVSVLEPLFTEDKISPAIIKYQPVEPPMQPLRINFEEHLSSTINHKICARASMEDEESAFEYVEAVLLASDLNWEEFLLRWLSSDQILDPSLFDEVELFSNRSRHDQKLLFDCTNEILTEVCECYFGYSPWVSFVKHNIRPVPRGKDLIDGVWKGVEWHLLPLPSPYTLEQIMRKDMAKPGKWLDLRVDVESIGTEIEEAIFEELMLDTILSSVSGVPEMDSSVPLTELNKSDEN